MALLWHLLMIAYYLFRQDLKRFVQEKTGAWPGFFEHGPRHKTPSHGGFHRRWWFSFLQRGHGFRFHVSFWGWKMGGPSDHILTEQFGTWKYFKYSHVWPTVRRRTPKTKKRLETLTKIKIYNNLKESLSSYTLIITCFFLSSVCGWGFSFFSEYLPTARWNGSGLTEKMAWTLSSPSFPEYQIRERLGFAFRNLFLGKQWIYLVDEAVL